MTTARALSAVSCAALSACAVLASAAATAPSDELAQVAATNARLRVLGELAASESYALVLDLHASKLELMLRGAVLSEYPASAVEIGTRRIAFLADDEPDWRGTIRDAGNLVPPRSEERLEIKVPEPGATPPSDEALQQLPAVVVPDRYLLRFDDGFALEIVKAGTAAGWDRIVARLADAIEGEAVRLRLTLAAGDAERLYRGLPPDVRFAVLD